MSSFIDFTYARFVQSRAKEMGNSALNFLHAAVGISTESGELLDVAKKLWVYNQSLATKNKEGVAHFDNIQEEIGDILFYVQLACNELGLSIETLAAKNMDKLTKRYPTGYSDAAAAARADKTEGN